jgi:hypothetical protein
MRGGPKLKPCGSRSSNGLSAESTTVTTGQVSLRRCGAAGSLFLTCLLFATQQQSAAQGSSAANGSPNALKGEDKPDSIDPSRQTRTDFADAAVRIRVDVPAIKQPSPMSCWATVYAMMKSWKAGKPVSIEAAIAELGPPFTSYLSEDNGLPGGQELAFVKAGSLHAMPPASYPLTLFRKLLRDRGPVWIITGDGITSHARLLVGIYGASEAEKRATYEATTMEFIDPASGTYVYEPALKFYDMFERETAFIVDNGYNSLDLRWQVISY